MFGFFTTIFGRELTWASLVLILGEIIYYMVFKLLSLAEMKLSFEDFDNSKDDDLEDNRKSLLSKRISFKNQQPTIKMSEKYK